MPFADQALLNSCVGSMIATAFACVRGGVAASTTSRAHAKFFWAYQLKSRWFGSDALSFFAGGGDVVDVVPLVLIEGGEVLADPVFKSSVFAFRSLLIGVRGSIFDPEVVELNGEFVAPPAGVPDFLSDDAWRSSEWQGREGCWSAISSGEVTDSKSEGDSPRPPSFVFIDFFDFFVSGLEMEVCWSCKPEAAELIPAQFALVAKSSCSGIDRGLFTDEGAFVLFPSVDSVVADLCPHVVGDPSSAIWLVSQQEIPPEGLAPRNVDGNLQVISPVQRRVQTKSSVAGFTRCTPASFLCLLPFLWRKPVLGRQDNPTADCAVQMHLRTFAENGDVS